MQTGFIVKKIIVAVRWKMHVGWWQRVSREMGWRLLQCIRRAMRVRLDEHVVLWCLDLGVAICEHSWQVWEQKCNMLWGREEKEPGSLAARLSSWTNTNRCLPLDCLSEKNKPLLWKQLQSEFLLLVVNTLSSDRASILCQVLVVEGAINEKYRIPALSPCLSWFVERNLHSKLKKTKIFQCFDWSIN